MLMWYNIKYLKRILAIYAICFIVALITGCSTPKCASVPATVLENTQSTSNDSILSNRFIEAIDKMLQMQESSKETKIKQTVHEKDSIAPIYDDKGEKIGENRFHLKEVNNESSEVCTLKEKLLYLQSYKDSCSLYKSKIDSLKSQKDKVIPYYIEKKLNVVQKVLIAIGAIFVILFFLYILLVVRNMIKKKKLGC